MLYIYFSIAVSVIALFFAGVLYIGIKKRKIENKKARELSKSIYKGAMAFLNKEYKVLVFFVIIAGLILYFLVDKNTAFAFLAGVILSGIAGNIGMRIATSSNAKTAEAAKKSLKESLKIAFSSGSVLGMSVVGLGLLGVSVLYWLFKDPQVIYGFGFGASSIALFARVGGGIYAKASDIGADLVGKIEQEILEDDLRNPVVIADNVGDNVGDVAGMGADLFESYVDVIIATMVIGSFGLLSNLKNLIFLPLVLAAVGIIAAILGSIFIKTIKKKTAPHKIFKQGIFGTTILTTIFSFFVIRFITGGYILFWAFLIGLASGLGIGLITEYFTSHNFNPTKKLAISAQTGSAINVLNGLSLGMKSTLFPTLIICITIFLSYLTSGVYGIAIAAVGMLSTLGIIIAVSAYGPVVDNASGIAEMSQMGVRAKKKTKILDTIGNSTAATGKSFAIVSTTLTTLVLLASYGIIANLKIIDLLSFKTIIGLFLGGLMPFLFSSLVISSVGKAAMQIIYEARRQFKKIKGLLEGKVKPDYARCMAISTSLALKEMILPGVLVILVPILVGFGLGKEALASFLISSIITGFLLAIMMANSGAAWDNAKKYIEAGNLGNKGSNAHKAAIIGDTVGDSLKDTAGPSLNILLKLMAIIALIIAPFL